MGLQNSRFPEHDEFSAGMASLQNGGSGSSYKMRDMVGGKSPLMYVNLGACRWTSVDNAQHENVRLLLRGYKHDEALPANLEPTHEFCQRVDSGVLSVFEVTIEADVEAKQYCLSVVGATGQYRVYLDETKTHYVCELGFDVAFGDLGSTQTVVFTLPVDMTTLELSKPLDTPAKLHMVEWQRLDAPSSAEPNNNSVYSIQIRTIGRPDAPLKRQISLLPAGGGATGSRRGFKQRFRLLPEHQQALAVQPAVTSDETAFQAFCDKITQVYRHVRATGDGGLITTAGGKATEQLYPAVVAKLVPVLTALNTPSALQPPPITASSLPPPPPAAAAEIAAAAAAPSPKPETKKKTQRKNARQPIKKSTSKNNNNNKGEQQQVVANKGARVAKVTRKRNL